MPPVYRGLLVRHLERIPLGTPYPAVVEYLGELLSHPRLGRNADLVVDATGVGTPVVDLLRDAGLPCGLTPVTITGGDTQSRDGTWWHVPKVDLLAGVRVLLEAGELRIARALPEAGNLVRELVDIRARPRRSGGTRLGADGHGQHDDLVMALALACWKAGRPMAGPQGRRLPGI